MKKFVLPLLLWTTLLGAESLPPDELIRQTTERALSELQAKRDQLEQDPEKLYRLIDEVLLPHIDFERTAQLILGRHWRMADAQQQKRFVMEFRTLLVRTYAIAVFEYNGEKIQYKPLRMKEGDTMAVVQAEIESRSGPPIPFHYNLEKSESGDWKVFDISIDGISLVTNYRTSYGRMIQQKGMDGMLDVLAAKNREAEQ
ncbi:MAG: ABC transporter substrate-binding protein [Gammaproteobacteria bacterium]|nr:ABC transporter substrate-binding protein [Gammaproteobacteria bacterium]MDH3464593.1 ABC transporter substrate-binding protein [Gammaproteobacteria bacterium]